MVTYGVVLAVYVDAWGRDALAVILAIWPDSHGVWSGDRLHGGAPYRTGKVDPQKVAALVSELEEDGLFVDEKLSDPHFGVHFQFTTIFIKSGKKVVKMESDHELFEASGKWVGRSSGTGMLGGRRSLDVLRKEPAEYLYYRFVWSEIRGKLNDLLPGESQKSVGKPVMKAGVLSWQESSPKSESGHQADPKRK